MIVCPELKACFIHIYKTGGSSATRILSNHTTDKFRSKSPRFDGDGWQGTWHLNEQQHSTYKQNENRLQDIADDNWYYLVISRNPYDWFSSVFYEFYLQDLPWNKGPNFLFGKFSRNRTFEDFMDFYSEFKKGYPEFWGFCTQKSFIEGIPENKIKVIRFENYDEDVRNVMLDLGVVVDEVTNELQRGSKKNNFQSYLKSHPKYPSFINSAFHEDFANFGYEMIG